jgi:REP element-mobilizing transposase RayT
MQVTDYQLEELQFAYCYHAFFHWRTHRRKPYADLAALNRETLHALVDPYGIHVLECDCRPTEGRVLVSLRPNETTAACANKLKGRVSKWLRERLRLEQPTSLLARGYFASTSGGTTTEKVEAYLESQGEHHGYDTRVLPPVFLATYEPEQQSEPWWHADHAFTHLQFHVVLATANRRGLFGPDEGAAVAARWLDLQVENRFALRKVSFLPDHIHIAVLLHPAVAPAEVVLILMNEGQRLLADKYSGELVGRGLSRVWQPSAYIGSYGELATPQVQKYIRRWREQE